MAHPVLKGYHPTIEKQLLSNEVLETDTMDRLKDDFEDGKFLTLNFNVTL